MSIKWIWMIGLVLASLSRAHAGAYLIHGDQRTCWSAKQYERAINANDYAFVWGWSHEDFDLSTHWLNDCASFLGVDNLSPSDRVQVVAEFEKGYIAAVRDRYRQMYPQKIQTDGEGMVDGPGGLHLSCKTLQTLGLHGFADNSGEGGIDTTPLVGVPVTSWNQEMVDWLKQRVEFCVKAVYFERRDAGLIDNVVDERFAGAQAALARQQEIAAHAAATAQRKQDAETCFATPAYKLWEAEDLVINDVGSLAQEDEIMAYQHKVDVMSGTRNLAKARDTAEAKLEYEDALKTHWAEYKKAHGKAASPKQVKHTLADPCAAVAAAEINGQ